MSIKFLQSFDKKIQPSIDIQKENDNTLQELKLYYEQEIKLAEANAYKKAQQEFNQELKTKIKEVRQETLAKYSDDIQQLTNQYDEMHQITIENFSKIVFIFFKNYVPLVTKKILNQEIHEQIELIFKNIYQKKIRFIGHSETISQIQRDFSIESTRVEWFDDDSLSIGDLNIEFDGGGVSFSVKNIESQLNEIFKNCFNFDISQEDL